MGTEAILGWDRLSSLGGQVTVVKRVVPHMAFPLGKTPPLSHDAGVSSGLRIYLGHHDDCVALLATQASLAPA